MASQKKDKASGMAGPKIMETGRLLIRKGERIFSILASPFRLLKKRYLRWPRVLQICSLYLFVLLLTGAIFIWRSAQLRTINPYIENLEMSDLGDSDLLKDGKRSAWGRDHREQQEGESETAAAGAGPGEILPREEPPARSPSVVWPVQGRVLREFGDPVAAVHADNKGQTFTRCRWLEIETKPGAEVVSIMSGTVERIISAGYPGEALKINHENGRVAYYAALDKIMVTVGERISFGQAIATVRAGEKAGPTYLYLEIKEEGRPVDPREILPAP